MRKLILVVTCILILGIFITFNYLLWDRENKIRNYENINYSKNASIDALGEKIKSLDDNIKQLNDKIADLENKNKLLTDRNAQLTQDNLKIQADLKYKNDLINVLKQQSDIKPFEAIVKKWADGIDKSQYAISYDLQDKESLSQDGIYKLEDFINAYKGSIKSMKVKSVKMTIDFFILDRKGDITLDVTLDVKVDGSKGNRFFSDGTNERLFTLALNSDRNDWIISSISNLH